MSWLIVPDIHEAASSKLDAVKECFQDVDHVIFLGDWFDTFGTHRQEEMCTFIQTYLGDDKFTFLMGNHDAHYRWTHHFFQCSGWNAGTQRIVSRRLRPADWNHFKISTFAGPYLVSHGGYHPDTYPNRIAEAHATELAEHGGTHSLFNIGKSRGGWDDIGGPLWLDFNWEFEDIPGQPQIVGHTVQRNGPRASPNGESFCIDTGLNHLGFVDDNLNFKIGALEV